MSINIAEEPTSFDHTTTDTKPDLIEKLLRDSVVSMEACSKGIELKSNQPSSILRDPNHLLHILTPGGRCEKKEDFVNGIKLFAVMQAVQLKEVPTSRLPYSSTFQVLRIGNTDLEPSSNEVKAVILIDVCFRQNMKMIERIAHDLYNYINEDNTSALEDNFKFGTTEIGQMYIESKYINPLTGRPITVYAKSRGTMQIYMEINNQDAAVEILDLLSSETTMIETFLKISQKYFPFEEKIEVVEG